jgi:hypothetical protein
MKRRTKKEMVLEIYDREAMGEVSPHEIAIINQGLIDEFGEGGAMTPAEIARVLVDEDLPVRFDQIFRMKSLAEKYEFIFEGLAINKSLSEAEKSLSRIDELYHKFLRTGDRTRVRFARQTALRAKSNALALSHSPNLDRNKRAEQAEISHWLTIWLETPEIFPQWLELRKATPHFKAAFLGADPAR